MTIGGVCVVKNEDRWIRYALNSIKEYVEPFIVIDNGSTDRTVPEIKRAGITPLIKEGTVKDLRNFAADKTMCDWIWWIDGDEVWCKEEAEKVVEAIMEYKADESVSILNPQLYRFIGDRFHYDGKTYRMPRIYRNKDVRMYGQSFPRAIDALARKESDLKQVQGKFTVEVRVDEPYIKEIDATFYHYSECNTLLDRTRKWWGYIHGSNPSHPGNKLLEMVYKQDWGIHSEYKSFIGVQPEVFNIKEEVV